MDIDNNHGTVFKFIFQINRRDDGSLAGFDLIAKPQGEAEFFCKTFLRAIQDEQASIGFCEIGLRLKNNICPFQPADLCLPLDQPDKDQFRAFFESGGLFKVRPHQQKIGFSVIHD